MDFALYYADEGLRVLPLHSARSPDSCTCGQANCSSVAKHPITRNGVKDATYDQVQIREWWRLYPDANVGIATGEGLLVIDIDPRHGGSLEALQALVELPATATVQTGSGGGRGRLRGGPSKQTRGRQPVLLEGPSPWLRSSA